MFHYITVTLGIIMPILKFPDVRYTSWLSLLSTNLSLFIQCNKQTNTHTHSPFSTLSV